MSDGHSSSAVPVREGLFTSAEDGSPRLIGGLCVACRHHHFPLLTICPYCSAEGVTEARLSAVGSLPPGYRGEVPFGFGVVELPEGLRVITRLTEPAPDRLERGQPMRLVLTPLHVDQEGRSVVTYAFAPAVDPR